MAEGYTSWTCDDLNGATLYSSDVINNPDWYTYRDFCPLVRPYGFNIMALYDEAISDAKTAGENYDSGIVRLARIHASNQLQDVYMYIRIYYTYSATPGADRITITIGATSGHNSQWVFDYDNYTTWEDYKKSIYILRRLNRYSGFTYNELPGYTGTYTYHIMLGWNCYIYTGVWESPSSTYPYGHMVYTNQGHGEPGSVLLSIPCAFDNEQSRYEQSEGVFNGSTESFYTDQSDFYFCGFDGNIDTDPENPRKKDPNEEDPGGESGEGGGGGQHIQPYVPIPIPGLPTIGPNSAGFVYMLRLTVAQMQQFALDLVRPSWWTVIKNFFADPLDFICGIMIVPYQPVSNYSVYPKFGDNIFEHAYPQVYQQYTEIDCGGLPVPKYFGSCFDNNPYTELLLWLPYIGYRKLDPDECVGKTIYVKYHCDCLTGDCVAFVMTSAGEGYDVPFNRVIAQFSGNCGVRVPFGATSFDAAIAASVQLLGGAVGAVAGGALGAAVGVSGASIGASQIGNSIAGSTVSAVNGSKVTSERSGVSGACAGYLSIQYPYLLRTVPNQSLPKNYQDLEGYPSNIAGPLTNFSGFTAVETIDLNGLDATKEEIDEIKQLLIGGVYI